jgi:hypothetical protein
MPQPPHEMVWAMNALLREYELAPVHWSAVDREAGDRAMWRAKELLAPFGIDPAPWAKPRDVTDNGSDDALSNQAMAI